MQDWKLGKALIELIDEAIEILVVLTLIGLKNTILGILKTRIFVINYLDAYYCNLLLTLCRRKLRQVQRNSNSPESMLMTTHA